MLHTDIVVIGAGHAGLAMSRCLAHHGIEHVVLERGRVAERWRSERWDSLHLLSPNWQLQLPDFELDGLDLEGYMPARELVARLARYAGSHTLPVHAHTRVLALRRAGARYLVATDRGEFCARGVVIATGYCDTPTRPAFAAELAPDIMQLTPSEYRRPQQLPPGGVLVAGASATGAQLADELARAGKRVHLAVGRHLRLPRRYRDLDIMWWLDRVGMFDQPAHQVRDIRAALNQPSFQLIGREPAHQVDLPSLERLGVELLGRASAARGRVIELQDDLAETTAHAEAKRQRLLDEIDAYARKIGIAAWVGPPDAAPPFIASGARTRIDLRAERIGSVIWATGYRREYPWLQVEGALDAAGELRHEQGVMSPPGLFALGLRFMRRRNSSFLAGAARDAQEIAVLIRAFLDPAASRAA